MDPPHNSELVARTTPQRLITNEPISGPARRAAQALGKAQELGRLRVQEHGHARLGIASLDQGPQRPKGRLLVLLQRRAHDARLEAERAERAHQLLDRGARLSYQARRGQRLSVQAERGSVVGCCTRRLIASLLLLLLLNLLRLAAQRALGGLVEEAQRRLRVRGGLLGAAGGAQHHGPGPLQPGVVGVRLLQAVEQAVVEGVHALREGRAKRLLQRQVAVKGLRLLGDDVLRKGRVRWFMYVRT